MQTNDLPLPTEDQPTDVDRQVGRALARIAKDRRVTQTDLVDAGLVRHQTQISRYFNGSRPIPIGFLVGFARTVGVQIDTIFVEAELLARTGSVESAIDQDPELHPLNRAAAKAMLRGLRHSGPAL